MELGDALRNLAEVVEELEESSAEVTDVTPGEVDDRGMVADLRVRIPAEPDGRTDQRTDRGPAPIVTEQLEPDDSGGSAAEDRQTSAADGGSAVDQDSPDATRNGNDSGTADGGGPPDNPDDPGPDTEDATDSGSDSDEADPASAEEESIGCTVEGCDATFDSEHGMRIHRSKAHGPGSADRDPETLSAVYDRYDSFAEMCEALDADVSPQTVRRWMIEADIHTPSSRSPVSEQTAAELETGADSAREGPAGEGTSPAAPAPEGPNGESDGSTDEAVDDPGSEAPDSPSDGGRDGGGTASGTDRDGDDRAAGVVADGQPDSRADDDATEATPEATEPEPTGTAAEIDERLPPGVSTADLQEAVQDASTLYEVQKRLDMDREATRELLAEFDLLELVHGRVADRRRREELKDEIDYRLRTNGPAADSRSD